MLTTSYHPRFMQAALSLARRNLGQTWPNPSVGAIVVKNDQIVGTGYTAHGGRPHAETQALAQAGALAKEATLYVTLEPCAHQGKTPPCTEAVIKSGITHCVIACQDPNPQVTGKGADQLRKAGIKITEKIYEKEAIEINCGFFSAITKKRPFIALKLATSLDGKIAFPPSSTSQNNKKIQWITSERARNYGHLLRSRYDAIATGIGTVLADDPLLTCRLPGLENKSPVRIVFDSALRIPSDTQLVKTAETTPVWLFASDAKAVKKGTSLPHVKILPCGVDANNKLCLEEAMSLLVSQGITRLLVEAGSALSTAFLREGLVDRLYWFRAPIVIGPKGKEAWEGGISDTLTKFAPMTTIDHIALEPDSLEMMECLPA